VTATGDRIRSPRRETEVLPMGDNRPRFDLPSRPPEPPNDDEWTAQRFKVAVVAGGYRVDTWMPLTGGLMQ
jgi:hypothetical protein